MYMYVCLIICSQGTDEEDANNCDTIPKKRPIEFEHNLYCSQLNYTDSSSNEMAETQ